MHDRDRHPPQKCPRCSCPVEDPGALRCPRCRQPLQAPALCSGNCRKCGKKKC